MVGCGGREVQGWDVDLFGVWDERFPSPGYVEERVDGQWHYVIDFCSFYRSHRELVGRKISYTWSWYSFAGFLERAWRSGAVAAQFVALPERAQAGRPLCHRIIPREPLPVLQRNALPDARHFLRQLLHTVR